MPGYYLHFAACGGNSLENRSFVLGVEAPDILKKHVKFYGGVDKARAKYNSMRTSEMPEYDELLPRILQKETADNNAGLHYGLSSNPDVRACWAELSDTQKANHFYRGYVWHLLTDAIMYGRLNIEEKFRNALEHEANNPNFESLYKKEVKKLHEDWDKTNAHVRETYPNISLTEEVKELGVVQFLSQGEMTYVNWTLLKQTIDFLRTFDPLNGDMNFIIGTVLNSI